MNGAAMGLSSNGNGVAKPKGKEVLSALKELVSKQPKLLTLPALSGIAALIGFLLIVLPLGTVGVTAFHNEGAGQTIFAIVILWVGLFVSTAVAVYFQVALVFGINAIMDGQTPTVGWCIGQAKPRLAKILGWSALVASVGLVWRLLTQSATESDNGWVALVGSIVSAIGATAWAMASFFVVPLIVAKNVSPVAGLKESAKTVKATFGTTMRSTIRFGFIEALTKLAGLAIIAGGVLLIFLDRVAPGISVIIIGIVITIAAVCVFSALRSALNAVLYRYAETGQLPQTQSQGFQEVSNYLTTTAAKSGH